MKQSFNDILNYGSQIKNESIEFGSSIGEEFKGLIGNFKSDINPNIENYKATLKIYKIVAKILVITFQTISSLKLWQLSHSFFTLNLR